MEEIRVLVNGAKGRMGQESVKAIEAAPGLVLVGSSDIEDDLEQKIQESKAQVVVDFTTAEQAFKNVQKIIAQKVHPVIGTSGLLPEQVELLKNACTEAKLGAIIAPNFAIGAVLMMKYAQDAVKYFPHVEIIELHHNRKADAPSGTAIKTASMMAAQRKAPQSLIVETEILEGARGATLDDISIHSIRLPGMVAHQEVLFGGASQTLRIRHDSIHRESFMPGVCLACKKVVALKELIYGLEHIL